MTNVLTAAQRNHHSALRATLSMAIVAGRRRLVVAERGERRHLDEVEVVQQADPGDAGQDVQPPEPELAEAVPAEEIRCSPRALSVPPLCEIRWRERSSTRRGTAPDCAGDATPDRPLACIGLMAHEFIYTCYKLARFYPPDRTVLENISLSFYPGAKIGVLGANGAGKSSLLRIMAGLDDGYTGEARLTPGFTRRLPRPGAAARSRPRTSRAT